MTRLDRTLEGWDGELLRLEKRIGVRLTALVVSLVLLILGGLYASENFTPLNFGEDYARLSENPFDFSRPNRLHYRLLSPLLGYLLHLRGNLFPILTHGASLLFLATIYASLRRRSFRAVDALGIAFMMAFSINVLGEIHFPGTTDPVSYLFLLWALINLERPFVWGACFSLALLNHEANFFALPGLLLLALSKKDGNKDRVAVAMAAVAACIPWIIVRLALARTLRSEVPFSTSYYFSRANLASNLGAIAPTVWVGIFSAYKLAWFFPLAAILLHLRSGEKSRALLLTVIVMCATAQLAFGWDITRLMGLAFPAVLLGAETLRDLWGEEAFRRRMWTLLLLNLLVPQATAWGNHIITFHPLPYTILVQYVFRMPL